MARLLRLRQWTKNVIVFLPLLCERQITMDHHWLLAVAAFLCFGLAASAVYIINDLVDMRSDRAHVTKRLRPLAAGTIPVRMAVWLIPVFLMPAVVISLQLPAAFRMWMLGYFLSANIYTFWLKKIPIIDVITIALLHTARLLAGGSVSGSTISPRWLAFSFFFFLSLAFVKRCAELDLSSSPGYPALGRRILVMMGVGSGCLAAVMLAAALDLAVVSSIYQTPGRLWLLCPVFVFWINRLWLLAARGTIGPDPLLFVTRDRVSYVTTAVVTGIVVIARY